MSCAPLQAQAYTDKRRKKRREQHKVINSMPLASCHDRASVPPEAAREYAPDIGVSPLSMQPVVEHKTDPRGCAYNRCNQMQFCSTSMRR